MPAAAPGVTDVEDASADAGELDGAVVVKAKRKQRPKRQIIRPRGENLLGESVG